MAPARAVRARRARRLTAGNGDFTKQQRRNLRDDGVCAVAAHPVGRRGTRERVAAREGGERERERRDE